MALVASLTRARKADTTTWFLLGACVQFLLTLCLPIYVSFIPIATILHTHSLKTAVQSTKPTLAKSTSIPDDVLQGATQHKYHTRMGQVFNRVQAKN